MTMRRIAYWLALAFVFTIPWEDTIRLGQLGTIGRVIGLAAGAAWVISAVGRGRLRRLIAFQVVVLMLVIWNGLTVYWSLDPPGTLRGFPTYVQIFAMVILLWDLIDSKTAVRACLQAYVLGSFVAIAAILTSFVTGQSASYQRFSAPGAELDFVALALALGIPAAWYLASSAEPPSAALPMRAINYAFVPLAVFAMVLTGTRGAAVASIPTVVYIVWSVIRLPGRVSVRALTTVALLGVAVALVVGFAPEASVDRIASTSDQLSDGSDLGGRVEIWRESLRAFSDAPILGVGNDAHRAAVESGKVAHNLVLSTLVETGLIGVGLFVALVSSVVSQTRRLSGSRSRYWVTQLSVLAIGSMSLSVEDSKYFWLFLALAVAAGTASSPAVGGRSFRSDVRSA